MDDLYSIYQGTVVSNEDPLKLGRCKINVPAVNGSLTKADYDLLPWAIYISPHTTGSKRTTFILPKVGDVVWVQFIGGHKDSPVYFGSSFAKVNGTSEIPLTDEEYYNTDVLYSKDDVRISKNETKLVIKYGESEVVIDKDGNINVTATKDIKMDAKGNLSINANKINIKSGSTLEMDATGITAKADESLALAAKEVTSDSTSFTANAGSNIKMSAARIDLN